MSRPGSSVLGNISRKLVETAEEWTGREVVEAGTRELVEHSTDESRRLRRTLDFIGFRLFNFSAGQMWEMRPIARRLTAQKALTAFAEDPMAAQHVNLYISFVFGRGVPRPQAHDPEVQNAIDEAWNDDANKRILTSFERLIEKAVDFNLQSNVMFLLFDDGEDGMVRLSLLRFLDVDDIVRHPIDRFRILYYKSVEYEQQYDYVNGNYTTPTGAAGNPRIVYYEALGAFNDDNIVQAVQDERAGGDARLRPPSSMIRPGKVIHLATNKTSEMAFGIPVMRRLLRWWSAMNKTLESHVDRMQAAASIYMKATQRGAVSGRDFDKIAQMATHRASPLSGGGMDEFTSPGAVPHRGPGILAQNESLDYEPMKIDSGAGDVAQSVPQIRGQFAAGAGFPNPGYWGGDPGALAGGQTIELPTLKFVEREQELWTDTVFRPFIDAVIQRKIDTGQIDEWRDPTDDEAQALAAAEETGEPTPIETNGQGQVKRDLGYDFSLPSPLKRAMADLVASAVQLATAIDPNATNPEVSRWLLGFCLSEAFDVDDPQRIVDQVLPRHAAEMYAQGQAVPDPNTGEPMPPGAQPTPDGGWVGPDGQRHPNPGNPYGAPVQSPPPERRRPVSETVTHRQHGRRLRLRRGVVEDAFDEQVRAVAEARLRELAHAANGNGTNH